MEWVVARGLDESVVGELYSGWCERMSLGCVSGWDAAGE